MSTVDLSMVRWRKSSRSLNGGNADCVEVALVRADWRKSGYSGNGGDGHCVEVAFAGPAVAVWDSKNTAGPVLVVPEPRWRAFLAAL